ncbi:MAG: Glyoxylate reductase [Deltaproteobacteria bacterium]|nr:Glyoxylate reductase [Deltaproteobacteria bacterium]
MRIVVLDGYAVNPGDNPWDALARLGDLTVYDRTSAEHILGRAAGADVLLVNKVPLTAVTLAYLPDLRFISVLATGYNVVDVAAARGRGIPVSNVPEYGTDSVAQHVFALLLELCHHLSAHHAAVQAGAWVAAPDFCFWQAPLIELAGRTMGIIGFGRIGRRVGEIAHAFGMRVIAAGGAGRTPPGYEPFAWTDMATVFSAADVISLHCPLTETNARFVNRQLLSRMQPSAFFINTARGQLVDEHALAEALNAGQLAGAGVDVVATEPMAPDNPLLHARNCLITPHMAWGSLAARRRLMATTVANVEAFLQGRPIHVVN